ncbi:MAG: hypothetical protein HKP12_08535 [Gammaproteobacteria bacterium]|nr:hypothetical protein [Gammaproteobacteria bacterium]
MLYRLAAVTLASTLLVSCGDESPFSDFTTSTTTTTTSGGGGGASDGGTATGTGTGGGSATVSSIVRKTQIPLIIPDGMGGTVSAFFESFDMGNSDESISYILGDLTNTEHVFRPDASGPVELYSRPSPEIIVTTTAGNGNKILSHTGVRDVIDYSNGNTQAIGVALGENVDTISDAGDIVAFTSNANLTFANPSGVNQLFTLSTDGADTYNQITTFTVNHAIETVVLSGDGRRIFFSSDDDVLLDGGNADGSYEVFSINSDGTGLARLSDLNSGRVKITRSSSDGSILALEIMDLNGIVGKWLQAFNTATEALSEIATTLPGGDIDYDMSADGSRAAYLRAGAIAGTSVIYVVNTDGSLTTDVLTESGTIRDLHLNTDGSQISFYSNVVFDTPIGADEQSIQVYTMTLL